MIGVALLFLSKDNSILIILGAICTASILSIFVYIFAWVPEVSSQHFFAVSSGDKLYPRSVVPDDFYFGEKYETVSLDQELREYPDECVLPMNENANLLPGAQ